MERNEDRGGNVEIADSVIKDFHQTTDSHDTHIGTQQNIGQQFTGPTNININKGPTAEERVSEILTKSTSSAAIGQAGAVSALINEGLNLDPTNQDLLFLRNLAFANNRRYKSFSLSEAQKFEGYCKQLFSMNPGHSGNTLLYVLFRKDYYPHMGMVPPPPDTSKIISQWNKVDINSVEIKYVLANGMASDRTMQEIGI